MENLLLLGILLVIYGAARWAFRAYGLGKPNPLQQLVSGHKKGFNTRRTLTNITHNGEYLGQPIVTLFFEGEETDDPDWEAESMLCARTLAKYPIPFSFETPLGAYHPVDMHDEVIRRLVQRYPIVNAGDLNRELIWENEGQWFDLTLKDDWLMLSIRDEQEDEDFGSVTFFVGEEYDASFSTPEMQNIDAEFLAYSDELEDEQALNYVARIPEPLLRRIYDFCKFMIGEVAVDKNSVLLDGSIWAADIELVDAFLAECIEISKQLRALGDPADSTSTPVPASDTNNESIW